ncbi:1-phosphofructokinase [Virgibacillus ainsalahensis]
MIYTVTLNPSIDYVVQADHVKLGEINHSRSGQQFPGGKGINVSRILKELGTHATALGFLGGFTGDFILKSLKNDAIPSDFIPIHADTRINIKIKSDTETEINARGPAIEKEEAEKLLTQMEKITSADTVILSGSKPPSLPEDYYMELIKRLIENKAEFIIDTTGKALQAALPYKPLLVKPNLQELEQLFDVSIHTKEQILQYGQKLQDAGAKHVIVSMAGEGAFLFTKNGIYQGTTPKGTVKNSVGAGDSMIAGFIGEYKQSSDAIQAFQTGIAAGSATAFSSDLAKEKDIQAIRDQVEIRRYKS